MGLGWVFSPYRLRETFQEGSAAAGEEGGFGDVDDFFVCGLGCLHQVGFRFGLFDRVVGICINRTWM